MIVDTALRELEAMGHPIRVGMVGAGATGRAISLQLGTPVPGIRLVAIANRTPEHAERAFREAGVTTWSRAASPREAETAIARGLPVVTDDPSVLTACDVIDVLVEVTGTVEAAVHVVLEAFDHGKHVVLVNAELDSFLGPILKAKADRAGVVVTHTDGDEPGVAMTLLRYLRSLGLRPVAAGNLKGMVDYYRTPETQRAFAEKNDQDPRKVTSFADATKLSMEATVLANATGFHAGRRGMYGPACSDVREMANLLPADQMLGTGLVDYALGAAPHTGAFVIVHEESLLKKVQLAYYKLGDGPFYVFYTPFHLPHIQIASTIGRAVIHHDATVAPIAGPVCEVLTVAKRDLKAGERLDGIGGFCAYGLIDNATAARDMAALPIALSEDCVVRRDVSKDDMLTLDDVEAPLGRVAEALWREQNAQWPLAARRSRASSMQPAPAGKIQ
jgi:predicted homoserine dehydrogenase-like protein